MGNVFKKSGFFWEECPYALWVVFSVMKCCVIWYLPILLAMFVNILCIACVNKDGEAEKKIKDYLQRVKCNSGCGVLGLAIGAQILFLVGVTMTAASVMMGGVGSDHFNADSGWFISILFGGVALVCSQAVMVGAFTEYVPEIKKETQPIPKHIGL